MVQRTFHFFSTVAPMFLLVLHTVAIALWISEVRDDKILHIMTVANVWSNCLAHSMDSMDLTRGSFCNNVLKRYSFRVNWDLNYNYDLAIWTCREHRTKQMFHPLSINIPLFFIEKKTNICNNKTLPFSMLSLFFELNLKTQNSWLFILNLINI